MLVSCPQKDVEPGWNPVLCTAHRVESIQNLCWCTLTTDQLTVTKAVEFLFHVLACIILYDRLTVAGHHEGIGFLLPQMIAATRHSWDQWKFVLPWSTQLVLSKKDSGNCKLPLTLTMLQGTSGLPRLTVFCMLSNMTFARSKLLYNVWLAPRSFAIANVQFTIMGILNKIHNGLI